MIVIVNMGQCVACKSSKVRPISNFLTAKQELDKMRAGLVDTIHNLHRITLDCSKAIETCITENNRDMAIVLKCKYSKIKQTSKCFQVAVKTVDDAGYIDKLSKKKEAINECDLVFKQLDNLLLRDDVEKIIKNEPEYLAEVKNEIKKLNISMKDVEDVVDAEFKDRLSSPGRMKRRRYSKKLSTLSNSSQ